MTDSVRIFDTTLRDGEQAPGFSMTEDGKLRMARALAALRVDVIEAGFAAASPGDAARDRGDRARDRGADHLLARPRHARRHRRRRRRRCAPAPRKRIHVFLGTSPIHREAKLHMSREQVLEAIRDSRRLCARAVPTMSNSRPRTRSAPSATSSSNACRSPPPSRRDHAQRPRHGRLHHARRDLRAVPLPRRRMSTRPARRRSSRPIATTISAWRSPIRWPRYAAARGRSNAPSTASASAPAIARSRTSSWR